MKSILTLFLFITSICFSQKQYQFDYILEYELTNYRDFKNSEAKKKQKYYLTNSKNNQYYGVLVEKDSLNYELWFRDNNGITSRVYISKEEFIKAEFININCEFVSRWMNPYKNQTRNYDFVPLNDTLINNKTYKLFMFSSIKPKREKRKRLGKVYYVIDENKNFHLPILTSSTAYEEWKLSKSIPNGPYLERLIYDYNRKLLFKETLVEYYKVNKKIIVPKKCDYTDKENDLRNRIQIIRDKNPSIIPAN